MVVLPPDYQIFSPFWFKMEVCASLLGYGVYWDRAPQ